MDELKRLPQKQYDKLLSRLAEAVQTRRNYITVVGVERINPVVTRYKVKRKGDGYPYLIEENFMLRGNIYLNLGVCLQ